MTYFFTKNEIRKFENDLIVEEKKTILIVAYDESSSKKEKIFYLAPFAKALMHNEEWDIDSRQINGVLKEIKNLSLKTIFRGIKK